MNLTRTARGDAERPAVHGAGPTTDVSSAKCGQCEVGPRPAGLLTSVLLR